MEHSTGGRDFWFPMTVNLMMACRMPDDKLPVLMLGIIRCEDKFSHLAKAVKY